MQPASNRYPNADLVGTVGMAPRITGPALVLCRKAFLENIEEMQRRCDKAGVRLRPHAKTHKSAKIAQNQVDAGAVGICCATAHEALILGGLGIQNILLTAPVVEIRKIQALALLSKKIDLAVVVDSPLQIDAWAAAIDAVKAQVKVLIDVDVGMGRTGARGETIVDLAARVNEAAPLDYLGVQAYSGHVQHIARFSDRRDAYGRQMAQLRDALEMLQRQDLHAQVVSGGGTGTMEVDCEQRLLTELQCGSYIFMDVQYSDVELSGTGPNPFKPSLFVRTHVISANVSGQATVSAGFKSLSTDGPPPRVRDEPTAIYEFFGDEYGCVKGLPRSRMLEGKSFDLIVPHCDTTVNLHQFYHVVQDDTLTNVWMIDARGVL